MRTYQVQTPCESCERLGTSHCGFCAYPYWDRFRPRNDSGLLVFILFAAVVIVAVVTVILAW